MVGSEFLIFYWAFYVYIADRYGCIVFLSEMSLCGVDIGMSQGIFSPVFSRDCKESPSLP